MIDGADNNRLTVMGLLRVTNTNRFFSKNLEGSLWIIIKLNYSAKNDWKKTLKVQADDPYLTKTRVVIIISNI